MPGYGSGMMQSPPFNSSQFPASVSALCNSPPQWATQIMEDIKSIKNSVSKIENIEEQSIKLVEKSKHSKRR